MKLILLSGGSGKRLWPLSNDSRSKQFLKVLKGNGNELESMVQRVWRQLQSANLAKDSFIATGKSQEDVLLSQLGNEARIIIEPQRRDTFPAISLAATYLYSMINMPLDEVVCVLPVDPYVDEHFFEKVKEMEEIILNSKADIALIGVKPTYPSEKYGYIIPIDGDKTKEFVAVSHFKEKPSEQEAIEMIEQNAVWNCGVFAFKLRYIIDVLAEKQFPIEYNALSKVYGKLPRISFDYQVVEKAQNIVVTEYDGYWKDLGTWNTLTDEMHSNQIGRGLISENSQNIHMINELDIPVFILGLTDAVVAASPDGILVSDKASSYKIKELMKDFDQRPMYEERRWGWYRVLDYTKYEEGREVLTKRICVRAGKNISYQLHHKRCEVWTIISGEGELVLNEEIRKVKAGDVVQIPVGSKHGIKASTDLEFIEVQSGSELVEEDIIRISLKWDEVLQACHV